MNDFNYNDNNNLPQDDNITKHNKHEKSDDFIPSDDFVANEDLILEEDDFSAEAVALEPQKDKPKKQTITQEILEWLDVLVTAIIAVVVIFSLIFRVATIDGNSMLNTLYGGDEFGRNADKVIITNLAYEPKQGDIVVVSRNIENTIEGQVMGDEPIIKRVIAVGGQTVNIDFEKGIVYVDGQALDEPYISTPTTDRSDVQFPVYVPEGCIFVLGDNRGDSLDSRSSRIGNNGLIDTRYVLGHAIFRVFPFDRMGRLDKK